MASYIERSLGEGETVIARAHFHWMYTLAAWLALILVGWLLIGIWIFLAMMIKKWTTEIGVTSHRFVMKTGLFTLRSYEIALPNIEGVKVVQNFIGRIFDFGTVRIEGTGVDAITTPVIADPVGFVRGIQTAKEHVAGLATRV